MPSEKITLRSFDPTFIGLSLPISTFAVWLLLPTDASLLMKVAGWALLLPSAGVLLYYVFSVYLSKLVWSHGSLKVHSKVMWFIPKTKLTLEINKDVKAINIIYKKDGEKLKKSFDEFDINALPKKFTVELHPLHGKPLTFKNFNSREMSELLKAMRNYQNGNHK